MERFKRTLGGAVESNDGTGDDTGDTGYANNMTTALSP